MNVPKHRAACLGIALLVLAILPAGAEAAFGVKSFNTTALKRDGSVATQAGSHPYAYRVDFEMNETAAHKPAGTLRAAIVDLPAGLVGNPQAVTRCRRVDFDGVAPRCPGDSQIGIARPRAVGFQKLTFPLYNLVPPPGVAASIGFSFIGFNSLQEASVRNGDFGVRVTDDTIPTSIEVLSLEETIWGVPSDPGHDDERECLTPNGQHEKCDSDAEALPFLTLPTSCTSPLKTTISVSSLEEPSVFTPSVSAFSLDEGGDPVALSGCELLPFDPTTTVRPDATTAESPSGLHVNLHVPQSQDPDGLATAHLKDTVVTLPEGMAVNPSAAGGLDACSPAQVDLNGSDPARCPAASKVGTVAIKTPLLDHRVPGSVYLAKQTDNPFGSLLALYIALEDPISGVFVKLAGKVEPDPRTGQLKATFSDNPQIPFEDFDVDFFGGPRATLTTPSTCGTFTTNTDLTPWSAPAGADAFPSDSFSISSGAGGGACVSSEAQAPNKPSFEAGTVTPFAGGYSPFVLNLSRENGSQRLAGINATLPKGLTGKLAGIPYCSEAQIAQAQGRRNPGEGAIEKASPSCPLASEVGTVTVGAGSGAPFYVQGNAYLAGPYKGAPISLVIITPAVAGPFDLGAVVVRTALQVNSETAQIHAVSDPLPSIIQGIPLDLRSISLKMDRPDFTLNPTSCDPMAITGAAATLAGQSAALTSPFQVGGCSSLKFKPKLAVSLKGATKRTGHPALRAVLTYPKGKNANVAKAQVTLPHSAFLDTTHIKTICTRVQFAADSCPKGAIYGHARAFTPLLDKPVEGPVYLRSSNNKLPDLVAALDGQVDVDVVGRVDTGKGDGIRNTFEAAPDAPVSKFVLEMQGGKKGLLVNSENICSKPQRGLVSYRAHNGATYEATPLIKNDCGKKAKKKKKGSKHKRG